MAVVNCKACGAPFNGGLMDALCPDCKRKEVETFQKVRDYLRNNPSAKVDDIADATGIDETIILRFINQGRILKR